MHGDEVKMLPNPLEWTGVLERQQGAGVNYLGSCKSTDRVLGLRKVPFFFVCTKVMVHLADWVP